MPATAPTAAPEDTPVTPGSASGLRNTACITTPTPARAAPTSMATAIRGSRMDHTTVLTWESAGVTTARIASTGSSRNVPRLTLSRTATTRPAPEPSASHTARRDTPDPAVDAADGAASGGCAVVRDVVSNWVIERPTWHIHFIRSTSSSDVTVGVAHIRTEAKEPIRMTSMPGPSAAPYDALLLCSFGGPNAVEDVLPFLRNVVRGKGVPEERLAEVGEHYFAFGGKSPIHEQNLALRAELSRELAGRGVGLPVLWRSEERRVGRATGSARA